MKVRPPSVLGRRPEERGGERSARVMAGGGGASRHRWSPVWARCMWPAEVVVAGEEGVEVAREVAGLRGGHRWVGRAVAAVARSFGKP